MRWQTTEQIATIPMRTVGPIKIIGTEVNDDVMVPMATYETPLWPSTHRGARVCSAAGGIRAVVIDERMTRSILFETDSVIETQQALVKLNEYKETMKAMVAETSRFARLIDFHTQIIGNLIYIRFEYTTGDASGHNMVTLASQHLLEWLLTKIPALKYVSLSGNYCTDKKVSAVNGILGRGKNVVAEVTIPKQLCHRYLKTTAQKIVEINLKKNLIGNVIAGGVFSANAHFANMLLGIYLATGQDAANIVEGSQGLVYAEARNDDLYFSVTLPNIIVGTVGNGKTYDFVRENLKMMGCLEKREPGQNARRLAIIVAAAVLCGELSLLAALTNPGELMESHVKFERQKEG